MVIYTPNSKPTKTYVAPSLRVTALMCFAISIFSSFGLTDNVALELFSRAAFYLASLLTVSLFLYQSVLAERLQSPGVFILTQFFGLFCLYLGYTVADLNSVSLVFFMQFIVIIAFFFLSMQLGAIENLRGAFYLSMACMFVLFGYFVWAVLNPGISSGAGWAGGLSNPNLFGMCVLMLLSVGLVFFAIDRRMPSLLTVFLLLIAFTLIYLSKSRSSLLAVVAFCVTYAIWPVLYKRPLYYLLYILSTVLLVVFFTYSGAERILPSGVVNDVILSVSEDYGKNVDSGRSIIWNFALDSISDKPVFGWGTSLTTTSVLNTGLSFHNWYLTVAYHFGLVGLALYIGLLVGIWIILRRGGQNACSRLAGCALIGMMMTQVYEVALTQNNLSVGLAYWIIFGIAIGRVTKERAKPSRLQ